MLKYLLFSMLLIPLGFMGKTWWVVQNFLFIIFLLIVSSCFSSQAWCLGYNFWFDNLSYSLVLLTVWIVLLMISGSIWFPSFYSVGFIGLILMLLFLLCLSFISSNLLMFYLFFWGVFNSYFVFNFWVGVSAWAHAGWASFIIVHFISFLPLLVGIIYLEGVRGSLFYNLWFVNPNISWLDCLWYCAMFSPF